MSRLDLLSEYEDVQDEEAERKRIEMELGTSLSISHEYDLPPPPPVDIDEFLADLPPPPVYEIDADMLPPPPIYIEEPTVLPTDLEPAGLRPSKSEIEESSLSSTPPAADSPVLAQVTRPKLRSSGRSLMNSQEKERPPKETFRALRQMNNERHDREVQLCKDLSTMLNAQDFSDFCFIVEDKRLYVHKVILASRCPFYRKYFELNKAAKEMNVKDTTYPVFYAFLEFVYSANVSNQDEGVISDLYSLSITYEMTELQNFTSKNSEAKSRSNSSASSYADLLAAEPSKFSETRKKIASEIYSTEKNYVNSLKLILDELITPLQTKNVMTRDKILSIFGYWEVILNCHKGLLESIEQRVQKWDENPSIGDIFEEKSGFIKIYKYYVNNYDNSITALTQLKESVPAFKSMLSKLEFTEKLANLGLLSYLIMPVQRIPRYVLLLQDMLKHTTSTHPDYNNLNAALNQIKELADYINVRKHDSDEVNKILSIQQRIVGWPANQSLVKGNRKLIKEGILITNKDKAQIYLFSDAILICKKHGKDQLKYKGFISLQTASINSQPKSGEKWHFEVISPSGKTTFAADAEERESWIKIVTERVEAAHKDLLSTAFEGHEKRDAEGSRQYKQHKEEEDLRKRSEIAVRILEDERAYVENLRSITKNFVEPLREAAAGNYPVVPLDSVTEIFINIDYLYKSHVSFLEKLEKRVNCWEIDKTTLGDLFYEHNVDYINTYSLFIEFHPQSAETFERCMTSHLQFAAFVVEAERINKISVTSVLALPVKKLSSYYLIFQELQQYTPEAHADYDKLQVIIERLKEQTNTIQSAHVPESSGGSSRKLATFGKAGGSQLLKRKDSIKNAQALKKQ